MSLNPDHPRNRGKVRLFAALGYTQANWRQLEADIREQHLDKDATEDKPNAFATRYWMRPTFEGHSEALE